MASVPSLRAAMIGAGVLAASLVLANASDRESSRPGEAALLAAQSQFCTSVRGRQGALFEQLAAAKTELGPFPTERGAGDPASSAAPPLFENLGSLHFPITTAAPAAQRFFDQGLKLAYAFNHAEAARAFRHAQRIDPHCALCYWGEALVLGPNINAPMEPAANAAALEALRRAEALVDVANPKERALIGALARRYADEPDGARSGLDAGYADAMRAVAARYSDDADVSLLYVESLMDLSPWDYWEAAGARPKGHTAEIVALLEKVLQKHPEHPGAIHFYIHMVEASADPGRALPYANRLGDLMPDAGHLVHMPFHIYYRVGRYKDAIEANRRAVAVDERYLAAASSAGIYPLAYYPHNIHSLMSSAQMAGDGRSAVAAAEKLARVVSAETGRSIAWVQPILVAPYFAHAQFSPPYVALAQPDPGSELPYVKAMWHYTRGAALALLGRPAEARREVAAMRDLARHRDLAMLTQNGVPAPDLIELAQQVVLGRIAQSGGDRVAAQQIFERAVVLEDKLPYSEPPYWYYPVRQSLGAVLLEAGRLEDAESAFRTSLMRTPNSGWALYGLAVAHARQGRQGAAAEVRERFARAWAGDAAPDLARL